MMGDFNIILAKHRDDQRKAIETKEEDDKRIANPMKLVSKLSNITQMGNSSALNQLQANIESKINALDKLVH